MINEAFLVAALSLPATHHTHPNLGTHLSVMTELESLKDFIIKNNPGAEIFITPKGDSERLNKHGYEKLPFTWRDHEIWIQRKPKTGEKMRQMIGVSA